MSGWMARLCRLVPMLSGVLDPLEKLRRMHPTCVFEAGCGLSDVDLGRYVAVLSNARVFNSTIGDFSYVGRGADISGISIGRFCSIGPNVKIGLGSHPTRGFVSTHPVFYSVANSGCVLPFRSDKVYDDSVRRTILGNDVWIGANVIMPGGITVGTGAVIAAGSVVVKDVPPYAVVGGNPAQTIRYRFTDAEIQRLLASEWWNWSMERLQRDVDTFTDINRFLSAIAENDENGNGAPPIGGAAP